MTTTLPPVAKSFFTLCKKCDADRYHTVLAHTTSTSAKMKCEVCGATKKYTLPKTQSGAGASKRPLSAKTLANRETARRSTHQAEYEHLTQAHTDTPAQTYSIKGHFELNQKLQHPKFGMGFIRAVQSDKIEVVFQDEVKSLIHNRT